jgi:hypothetical protein
VGKRAWVGRRVLVKERAKGAICQNAVSANFRVADDSLGAGDARSVSRPLYVNMTAQTLVSGPATGDLKPETVPGFDGTVITRIRSCGRFRATMANAAACIPRRYARRPSQQLNPCEKCYRQSR